MMYKVGVLTLSDKGSRGEREDVSGQVIRELVVDISGEVVLYEVIPDDFQLIKQTLCQWADVQRVNLILTTGGTGLSPRDVTPNVTLEVIEYEVPGIAETMRRESLKQTPRAMLSRAVAGVRGRTLIINLPGSPKGVRECLEVILEALPHGLDLLQGQVEDCADA